MSVCFIWENERDVMLKFSTGETGGVPLRVASFGANGGVLVKMSEDFARFDLEVEIRDSESRKPWPSGKHSKTLVKKDSLQVVLFTMESGSAIKEHSSQGSITVQVLRGEILFRARDQDHSLRTGEMLALGPSIKHAVECVGDAAFLLTIS